MITIPISTEVAQRLQDRCIADESKARELARVIRDTLGEGLLCRRTCVRDPAAALELLQGNLCRDLLGTLDQLKLLITAGARPVLPATRGKRRGRQALSFIKWVGSKIQVMSHLRALVPERFGRYFEPMVGSGTLFFSLAPQRALLCDLNAELMNCYRVLRDHLPRLIAGLRQHRNEKEHFLQVRAQDPADLDPVTRAARTIFLNKTCFNGLYRVNSRGLFNVPFGRIWWANICDEPTLLRTSRTLRGARLRQGDYAEVLDAAGPGDLVYLDPPYLSPGERPTTFFAYQPRTFDEQEHERLARTFIELDRRGCHVLLSNSDVPRVRELYRGYAVQVVETTRMVNCKAGQRKGWKEVIIHNLASDKAAAGQTAR